MLTICSVAAGLCRGAAAGDEICRYGGVTSYDGHVAVEARASMAGGITHVDVRLALDALPLPLMHTHYLMQEISDTDASGIERLAVNNRYRVDGHIVRQSWDVFDRASGGLDAWRIEGKRRAQFGRQHPAFASHWDFSSFGRPWLADFVRAAPERRTDLDLREMSTAVRPPLALAFHWLRRLAPGPAVVPVFLPGFKDRKRVDLAIGAKAPVAPGEAERQAPLRYPELSDTAPSTATAWLSSSGQVLQLAFDLHGQRYGARATIRALGCAAR